MPQIIFVSVLGVSISCRRLHSLSVSLNFCFKKSITLGVRCNTSRDKRTTCTFVHWSPCYRYRLGCPHSGRTLPPSGSAGSHHVCCLASPSPMGLGIYSLHKSIFVTAGCMEQTESVYWSSCSLTSVYQHPCIFLFFVFLPFSFSVFTCPLSFLFVSPFIFSACCVSYPQFDVFLLQREDRGAFYRSQQTTLQPQNLWEVKGAGKAILPRQWCVLQ